MTRLDSIDPAVMISLRSLGILRDQMDGIVEGIVSSARYSGSPDAIDAWSAECLSLSLFRLDGAAADCFRSPTTIRAMVYVPGLAWSVYHQNGTIRPHQSTFVHADFLRMGIGQKIFDLCISRYGHLR